jgi:hypothetical protein
MFIKLKKSDFLFIIYTIKLYFFYMKYVKKFESFIKESTITASPAPTTKPTTAPPITKPERPVRPSKPIVRPNVDSEPKAEKDKKVTEMDVVKRFIEEVNAKGESVEKYLNK